MERDQMLKVLVPVGGLAVLLLIVAAVIAITEYSAKPSDPTGPSGTSTEPGYKSETEARMATGAVKPFDFPLDGPEWKDIGNGLKIWDVKEGTGKECPPGATVKAQYTGWRKDGHSFDNPLKHGPQPIEFSLNQVVAGWKLGIPGMKVGGIRRLFIPAALGYGAGGQGRDIPPYTDLIFEVELAAIN